MPRIIGINQGLTEDGDFLTLSHEAQRAFFFLRLDARMGISGLARLAEPNLIRLFDVRAPKATALLGELSKKWVRYDQEAELIWIVDAYRHEPSKSPNVRKAVANEVIRSPLSSLLHEWWNRYQGAFPPAEAAYGDISRFLQRVPKPLRNPSDTPPKGSFARAPVPVPIRSGSGPSGVGDQSESVRSSNQRALDPLLPEISLPGGIADPEENQPEVVRPEYADAAAEMRRALNRPTPETA